VERRAPTAACYLSVAEFVVIGCESAGCSVSHPMPIFYSESNEGPMPGIGCRRPHGLSRSAVGRRHALAGHPSKSRKRIIKPTSAPPIHRRKRVGEQFIRTSGAASLQREVKLPQGVDGSSAGGFFGIEESA